MLSQVICEALIQKVLQDICIHVAIRIIVQDIDKVVDEEHVPHLEDFSTINQVNVPTIMKKTILEVLYGQNIVDKIGKTNKTVVCLVLI